MKLRNQEIWLAYINLVNIHRLNLPVKTSLAVATLISILQRPFLVIEGERQKIALQYGKSNPETNEIILNLDDDIGANYALDFGEVLTEEWGDDIEFRKLNLPLEVIEKFGIDSNALIPLVDKFIEKFEGLKERLNVQY